MVRDNAYLQNNLAFFCLFSLIKLFFSCNIKPLFNIDVKNKQKQVIKGWWLV